MYCAPIKRGRGLAGLAKVFPGCGPSEPQPTTRQFVVKTLIPPLGKAAPPPDALGLVNGVNTLPGFPGRTATEWELFPLGSLVTTVLDAPSTTASTGVSGHAAEPPPHEFPLAVQRLSARNHLFEVAS